MSDYRNQHGYGRDEDSRDERYGNTDDRTARRGSDIYGSEGRYRSDNYRRDPDEVYARERDGRYGERTEAGYGRSSSGSYGRPTYSGSDIDRGNRRDRHYGYSSDSYGPGNQAYGYDRNYNASGDRYRDAFGYGNDRYGANSSYNNPQSGERSFFERASDEVSSWFGDRDAERRREADRQFGDRGPKNYTRSDTRIQDDVNDRLTDDHYIDASDIDVSVKDREVTLTGHVANRDQKRRAEDLAERVSGVSHVQNNLRVKSGDSSVFGTTTTSDSSASGSSIL